MSACLEKLTDFLQTFCVKNKDGTKTYKYASQLTNVAHREQVSETFSRS